MSEAYRQILETLFDVLVNVQVTLRFTHTHTNKPRTLHHLREWFMMTFFFFPVAVDRKTLLEENVWYKKKQANCPFW